jgi:predicted GNAT family acetyltransferase
MPDAAYSIVHIPERNRFEAQRGGAEIGLLTYRRSGELLVVTHTEVNPEIGGRGVGRRLVRAALEYARQAKLRVLPRCPFAAAYIRRHKSRYMDLVDAGFRDALQR